VSSRVQGRLMWVNVQSKQSGLCEGGNCVDVDIQIKKNTTNEFPELFELAFPHRSAQGLTPDNMHLNNGLGMSTSSQSWPDSWQYAVKNRPGYENN